MTCVKPTCGSQGASTDDTLTTIVAVAGVLGTLAGAIGKAIDLGSKVWTLLGITAPALIWMGAILGAAATLVTVAVFWYKRCLEDPDSKAACTAGVIEEVVQAFESATEHVFPFVAMHDRVDVVVKCDYWPAVATDALLVKCNDDADSSPILQGFYHSPDVCGAGLGATIGAAAGAVAGVFLGVLAGAAIASLGCGPFAWACLILAIIVAALVAAAVALAGAFLGGQAGRLIAEETTPTAEGGAALGVGDYVTTTGGLITSGDMDGARVYWFVDNTILHGRSSGSPPYSHTDPDANLDPDGCPSSTPPIG